MIELSEFFKNPSLIQIGPLKIQYYALTWILSAVFIFQFLKLHNISKELGLDVEKAANEEQVELKESIKKNGGSTTKALYEIYKADLDGLYPFLKCSLT